ncbi:MAG TPA: NAD-dependent epimerase/dehydratase family protein [Candidatus Eremiobacteraceae bacterium]|nr:NAD-dependent epimerase/dehydratase family protein [Candidatus Eremiobacteraceae bacterium]
MKYLVTGGQGFVGRYLIARLIELDKGAEVMALGRSRANNAAFTHKVHLGDRLMPAPLSDAVRQAWALGRVEYHALDINDQEALQNLLERFRPSVVFHLASGLRDDTPAHLFRTNVEGTINLLEAIFQTRSSIVRLVIGSSGAVYGYGSVNCLPLGESASCSPMDLYSASKLASEHVSKILSSRYCTPVLWARIFNVVGAGQDERHICGRVAAQASAIALGMSRNRTIEVGDLSTTRDFIDVRDVADALLLLAKAGTSGTIYNVATGVETSIERVVQLLLDIAGLSGTVTVARTYHRAADTPRNFADIGRLAELGFRPAYRLRDSLESVFNYYNKTLPEAAAALQR